MHVAHVSRVDAWSYKMHATRPVFRVVLHVLTRCTQHSTRCNAARPVFRVVQYVCSPRWAQLVSKLFYFSFMNYAETRHRFQTRKSNDTWRKTHAYANKPKTPKIFASKSKTSPSIGPPIPVEGIRAICVFFFSAASNEIIFIFCNWKTGTKRKIVWWARKI